MVASSAVANLCLIPETGGGGGGRGGGGGGGGGRGRAPREEGEGVKLNPSGETAATERPVHDDKQRRGKDGEKGGGTGALAQVENRGAEGGETAMEGRWWMESRAMSQEEASSSGRSQLHRSTPRHVLDRSDCWFDPAAECVRGRGHFGSTAHVEQEKSRRLPAEGGKDTLKKRQLPSLQTQKNHSEHRAPAAEFPVTLLSGGCRCAAGGNFSATLGIPSRRGPVQRCPPPHPTPLNPPLGLSLLS
ncbi:unnamed protein product [Pleuronectes platessa]|uniref:Uncharacterized protein n=1 Tax=Pleuronectes platessa TaxID=8262 RepID=A0A9N7UZ04_PLEPL|nr:unnamed protein product [Pleuronectes platessa]